MACWRRARSSRPAGADAIVVLGAPAGSLSTLVNVARFHQAVALGDDEAHGLPVLERRPLEDPTSCGRPRPDRRPLARGTDVSDLQDSVEAVRG